MGRPTGYWILDASLLDGFAYRMPHIFFVPSNICLGFNIHTITSLLKPFCSPVRLSPVIGVMSGAHYQSSIQELLHPEVTFACGLRPRIKRNYCTFGRRLASAIPPKLRSLYAAHLQGN